MTEYPVMTLDEYLNRNGITEEAFAKLAGCSQGTVNKIRNGKTNPTMALLEAIRRASGGYVTPNDFLPFCETAIAPAASAAQVNEARSEA